MTTANFHSLRVKITSAVKNIKKKSALLKCETNSQV